MVRAVSSWQEGCRFVFQSFYEELESPLHAHEIFMEMPVSSHRPKIMPIRLGNPKLSLCVTDCVKAFLSLWPCDRLENRPGCPSPLSLRLLETGLMWLGKMDG